ncbi:MAG: tRNA lysidine(34) synthetase TilS [Clostridia bacterium]|nr:tRNA lysidine(34) synthetase TilS [Clostridia bacterium]
MGINEKIRSAVADYNMLGGKNKKITVAFSGGADSSVLLHWLRAHAGEYGVSVEAFHLNHMIRGEDADRDEAFCRRICEELGVPFESVRRDIPALAREWGCGEEEAGRRARYEAFEQARSRRGSDAVATAHHADDNLETVIFDLARGSGSRGLAGIPPVRGRIVRPLIYCTRREIEEYAAENGVPFVTDRTNADETYRRNFIRRNIAPALRELNPRVAETVTRMSGLLRADDEWLSLEGKRLLDAARKGSPVEGRYSCAVVALHHRAVGSRAVAAAAEEAGGRIDLLAALDAVAAGKDTRLSVGGGLALDIYRGAFAFIPDRRGEEPPEFDIPLEPGVPASVPGTCRTAAVVTDRGEFENLKKIHIGFTYTSLDRGTIKGTVRVRSRRPGDRIRVRGISRTVKNLLQEAGVPACERAGLPVFCDDRGPLWIPGIEAGGKDGGIWLCAWKDQAGK